MIDRPPSHGPHTREVAAFFDSRAVTYERYDMHQWLAGQAVAAAKISPGSEVLDVATGTGLAARALLARTERISVVGIDISAGMLAAAREKSGPSRRFPLVLADAMCLPFNDDAFDHVLCVASVAYLADADAALREWVRVCRTSGKVTITAFAENGITSQRLIRTAAAQENVPISDPNGPWGSEAALRDFAARAGLCRISLTHVTHQEPLRDADSGWKNFLRSPLADDLRRRDHGTVTRVYRRYTGAYDTMKTNGETNTRTSIILSGVVPAKRASPRQINVSERI